MAVASSQIWCSSCLPNPPAFSLPYTSRRRFCFCCSHSHFSHSHGTIKALRDIKSTGVIACLRAHSAELAIDAARAALDGGISVLEIVISTPGVFEVLQQLVQEYPTRTIGAGTVLNSKDAKKAIIAGAEFLMSPVIIKDVLDYVQGSEVLYIPGAMTPSEIFSAYNFGARIVKVYPISALGGIRYIEALQKPFSHIPLVASQGIAIDQIGRYIACGASSVVLSDAIFDKEAMVQRNFSAVNQLAQLAAFHSNEAVERCRKTLP